MTAIRLVIAANHAIHDKRRKEHIRELESLIERLNAKREIVQNDDRDPDRRERMMRVARPWKSASIYWKADRPATVPPAR